MAEYDTKRNAEGYVDPTAYAALKSISRDEKVEKKAAYIIASFDELNILNDDSSNGGGGSASDAVAELPEVEMPDWVQLMVDQLKSEQWGEAAKTLTEQLNIMIDSVEWASIGSKIATYLDGALTFLATAITTFDWYNLGASLGEMINSLITGVDWTNLGTVLGAKFTIMVEGLGGLFATLDWAGLGSAFSDGLMGMWNSVDWDQASKTLSDGVKGVINSISTALKKTDWQKIGKDVAKFISGIDWSGVVSALFDGIGAALGGLCEFLIGLLSSAWEDVVDWWYETAYEDGEFTIEGLLEGILNALKDIGTWIKDNIFKPFIDGFKSVFGINSPSTVMEEMGGYIVDGLYNGISNGWGDITTFFSEKLTKIKDTITTTWDNVKTNTSQKWSSIKTSLSTTWGNIKTSASSTWSNIKTSISTTWDNVKTNTSQKWSSIKTSLSTTWGNIKTSASNTVSSIKSSFQNGNWKSVGSNICDGISSGINSGWTWLKKTVKNLATNLLNSAKSALGIHSPSRLFRDEVGLFIGYGIGEGLEDSEGSILKSVCGVADAIAEEFNANEYQVGGVVSTMEIDSAMTDFSDKITDSFTNLLDRLQAIADRVVFQMPTVATGTVVPAAVSTASMTNQRADGTTGITPDVAQEIKGLFRQMMEEFMATQNTGDININFTGDLAQLARVLKPVIDKENHRSGSSLAREAFT